MGKFDVDFVYCSPSKERWVFQLYNNTVKVFCQGESRTYEIEGKILSIGQDNEYVLIHTKEGSNIYQIQIKFEENYFLVGDKFDKEGEHIDSIASHVFGEDFN